MRACVPTETEQRQREWMGDDFADTLRLGNSSIILFMGNFLMTAQCVPSFLSYMNISPFVCLFVFQLNVPKAQGQEPHL